MCIGLIFIFLSYLVFQDFNKSRSFLGLISVHNIYSTSLIRQLTRFQFRLSLLIHYSYAGSFYAHFFARAGEKTLS